jgi:hypothetical protein
MKHLQHLAVLIALAFVAIAEASVIQLPMPLRSTVVKAVPECRDAYVVSSAEGYQLIEWLAGDVLAVGHVLDGMWDRPGYQFVKMVDTELQSKIFVETRPMTFAQVNMFLQRRCDLWRD